MKISGNRYKGQKQPIQNIRTIKANKPPKLEPLLDNSTQIQKKESIINQHKKKRESSIPLCKTKKTNGNRVNNESIIVSQKRRVITADRSILNKSKLEKNEDIPKPNSKVNIGNPKELKEIFEKYHQKITQTNDIEAEICPINNEITTQPATELY